MYQCLLTLNTREPSERLMLNFNRLQINCSDTLYIYDSPHISGDPEYKLSCGNLSGTVIYSTNNSISLEFVTADDLGFNSNSFYLAYTPFNDSSTGCDGFICKEDALCIYEEFMCDGSDHCSDGSDEGDTCLCHTCDDGDNRIKLIALVCFVSFILFLGIIWLCAHTRKMMRNRVVIQRNGVANS